MRRALYLACSMMVLLLTSCSAAKTQKIEDAKWAFQFRTLMEKKASSGGELSIVVKDETPVGTQVRNGFSYSSILCQADFNSIPSGRYALYCPNTGCPCQPELVIDVNLDKDGNAVFSFPGVSDFSIPTMITSEIPAIPGFCSDWYLIAADRSLKTYHTTFTYKPIIARSASGKELTISKRECGGNILEISLKGFQPNERIQYTSNSEGEILSNTLVMDQNGTGTFVLCPQVVGKTKGVVTISVPSDQETLEASCDWNMATFGIERTQPYSFIHKRYLEIARQIPSKIAQM